jgi:hypothetical protein
LGLKNKHIDKRWQSDRLVVSNSLEDMTSTWKHYGKASLRATLIGIIACIQLVEFAVDVTKRFYKRRRFRSRRLPRSKPLLPPSSIAKPSRPTATSFLHLPVEVRLRIYALVLAAPGIIEADPNPRLTLYSARPPTWQPGQHIRSDADPPSADLRWHHRPEDPRPLRQGCIVRSGLSCRIVCGDQNAIGYRRAALIIVTDLLRTCRAVYADVLDLLYASNTMSFRSADMVRYFSQNTSPEGLSRVKYVHLALVMSLDSPRERKVVEGAVRTLRDTYPELRQLDVEIVLKSGQPADAACFWAWLRRNVFEKLRGLEEFVLKVPAYSDRLELHPDYPGPLCVCETLSAWDEGEYAELKALVTSTK